MIGASEHGLATGCFHSVEDLDLGAGDDDGADTGFFGPAQAMDDHGLAMDVGERLARQARGLQAGRDQHDGAMNYGHGSACPS